MKSYPFFKGLSLKMALLRMVLLGLMGGGGLFSDWMSSAEANTPVFQIRHQVSPGQFVTLSHGQTLDFGEVQLSQRRDFLFSVDNIGTGPLQDTTMSVEGLHSGEIVLGSTSLGSIGPGESGGFHLEWTTTAFGVRTATLRITSNDTERSPFLIPITVTVARPHQQVEFPTGTALGAGVNVDLGAGPLGETLHRQFTVRNIGNGHLDDVQVSIEGTHASEVSFSSTNLGGVGAGHTADFTLYWNPVAAGLRSATLRVTSNDDLRSPFVVPLTLNALPPEIQVEQGGAILSPGASVAFGAVVEGGAAERAFVIRNVGAGSLTDVMVTVEGPHADEVSVSEQDFGTIGSGGMADLWVEWTPEAVGVRSVTLRITSNDAARSPFLIPLTLTCLESAPIMEVHYPFDHPLSHGATVNFGELAVGSEGIETLYLVNVGSENLTQMQVSKSGPAAAEVNFGLAQQDDPGKASLEPYDNQYLWVAFVPGAVGLREVTLTITSNDGVNSPFLVHLTATGVQLPAELEVSELPDGPALSSGAILDYGQMEPGGAPGPWTEKALRIKNKGPGQLTGLQFNKSGPQAAEVSFGAYAGALPDSLNAGADFVLWVRFLVQGEGNRQAALEMVSNDAASPFVLQLTAYGLPTPLPALEVTAMPQDLEVETGETWTFGSVAVGSTVRQYFEISNEGTANLVVSAIAISGPNVADFKLGSDLGPISGALPATLPPGDEIEVWVEFKPGASGERRCSLTVEHNDAEINPFILHFSGGGAAPQLRLEELPGGSQVLHNANLSFGSMIVGYDAPLTRNLRLRNIGGAPLTGLDWQFAGVHAAELRFAEVSSPPPSSLAAGEAWDFTLVFEPAAPGARSAQLQLASNDPARPLFLLGLNATGVAPMPVLSLMRLDDGAAVGGGSREWLGEMIPLLEPGLSRGYRLINSGNVAVLDLELDVLGAQAAEAGVTGLHGGLPAELLPGQYWDFEVSMVAAAAGEREAELVFSSQNAGGLMVTMVVTGLADVPEWRVTQLGAGVELADGDVVDVGRQIIGAGAHPLNEVRLRLRNASAVPMTGVSLITEAPTRAQIKMLEVVPEMLGANEWVEITVKFLTDIVGLRQGVLHLQADGLADFVVNLSTQGQSWAEVASGVYQGLIHDEADGALLGVVNKLVVSAASGGAGNFSASFRFNGLGSSRRGSFTDAGGYDRTVVFKDGRTQEMVLQLERSEVLPLESGALAIRGAMVWEGRVGRFTLRRCPFHTRIRPVPEDLAGALTALLPVDEAWPAGSPVGNGWGAGALASSGSLRVKGRLGDGTAFTSSALLTAEGESLLYADLYRSRPRRGRMGAELVFRQQVGLSDFDGAFQWMKWMDERERLNPAGFQLAGEVLGARFERPLSSGERSLSQLVDQHYNCALILTSGGLGAGQIIRAATWQRNDVVTHYGPETLKARIGRSTGVMTGSYRDPATGLRFSFYGVVQQRLGLAAGQFVAGLHTGAVKVMPDTSPFYPGSEGAGQPRNPLLPESSTLAVAEPTGLWVRAAAGSYTGVLRDAQGGMIGTLEGLRLSLTGGLSALLWVEGERYVLRGTLNGGTGEVTLSLPRPGMLPLVVTLRLALEAGSVDGYQVVGTVAMDGLTHSIASNRVGSFSKLNRCPEEGKYTWVLASGLGVDPLLAPAGVTPGVMTVNLLGRVSVATVLADGTAVTWSGHVSASGEFGVARRIYGARQPKGYLAGWLQFEQPEPGVDLTGRMRWVKQPGATPRGVYPDGVDQTGRVTGCRYLPPGRGVRAFSALNDLNFNVWCLLHEPLMRERVLTWLPSNRLVYHGPEQLSLRFNASSGWVSGFHRDPGSANRAKIPVYSVLLQGQAVVAGFYLDDSQSGLFTMEPR